MMMTARTPVPCQCVETTSFKKEKLVMTAIKITKTNAQINTILQTVETASSRKEKNVTMEMKLTTMNAPTPVLFQYVATVFFNKLKTRSAMMETK